MSQFRKYNRPTALDRLWNISRRILYRKRKVQFELLADLYRFRDNIHLAQNVYVKRYARLGCANPDARLSIGQNCTIGQGSIITSSIEITMGNDCMLGPNVVIVDSNHGADANKPFNAQENVTKAVHIGDNVWIGAHSLILAGASIPSNTIIAANSVVNGMIERPGIYGGSPVRELGKK